MDPITIIQTSLIYHLKTGYLMIDILITILIVYLAKKCFEKLPKIGDFINLIKRFCQRVKSEYLIQGTVTISTEYCSHQINFPTEFRAVMYTVSKLGIDIQQGRHFNVPPKLNHLENDKYIGTFSYSINTDKEIQITKDIYVRQTNTVDKSNDLKSSIEFFNLFIYSYTLPFTDLKKQIDQWIDNYNRFVREYNDGNLYYFSYIGVKDQDIKYEANKFSTNKSFSNVFFTDKNKVIDRINYFMNNSEEYARLGTPQTLGFLFYGDPGCGKTSTIKAIANYTNRHIVEITLSKIKTCTELKKIFFNEMINEHYVPSNKKIIVLEDIDCMSNIVNKREECNELYELKKKLLENQDIDKKDLINKMIKLSEHDENDKITLSYILNLIDGVLEQSGRIMIITSNHPEKLDEALIRPGRIDMKVKFSKCSVEMINDILKLYFNQSVQDISILKNDHFTPAEVFEMCFNINHFDSVVEKLIR